MKKLLLIAAAFLGISTVSAFAACTSPAVMHDFPGTSFNMSLGTTPDGNCGSNVLVTTWGGVTLGAPSNYGTSPGAVAVPGVNAFITNTVPVTGTFWQTTQPVSGTFWQTTQPISAASLPLPTGAATSANQATEITSLGTIATNSATQATAALQTTGNTSLATIAANSGLPLPAQTGDVLIGDVRLIDASSNVALVDPCQSGAKTYTPINIVTAANTKIVAGTASKKTYICGLFLYPGATDNIAIIEGSGTNCGTSPLGLIGGNTAATGIIATAQAGFVLPTTGYAHAASTVNANDFCLITSAAVQLSGVAVTVAR